MDKQEATKDKQNGYDFTLDQMTLASAAIPLYFYPYEYDGKFYTSGDNIAASPSMYAW